MQGVVYHLLVDLIDTTGNRLNQSSASDDSIKF